ncbi:MAG: DUF4012 domain-containing protein [Parcubacteria group bacterium]|nr:DUF4012 domain-containing protein [Parcubacteria group bacterium]
MKKRIKKDYAVSINSGEKISSSPHVLNLKEVGCQNDQNIAKDVISSASKLSEKDLFITPEVLKVKRNRWLRFRMEMRLLFSSIFDRSSMEPQSMRIRSGSFHPHFRELFIVNFVWLILLAFWKTIKTVFKLSWGFINSFVSLFRKEEVIEEEIAPQTYKIRERILPRPLRWREAILVFVIVAAAIILPLRLFLTYEGLVDVKKAIMSAGEAALGHVSLAFEDPSLSGREEVFTKVEEQLSFANGQIGEINFILRNLISILPEKGEQFRSGQYLLNAGTELSYAASVLNNRFNQFENTEKIAEKFSYVKLGVAESLPHLENAKKHLDEVDENILPDGARDGVIQIKKMVDGVLLGADEFLKVSDIILNILGVDEPRRYLLIFQNNNEIRPAGGFIGSFAEIYVHNGEIEKTYFPGGGSYDLDGGLVARLIPPEPLQLIASRWHFRDSNWFPDFPSSAEKMMWFYEKSGGGTVDGVIAINASFMEDLLKLTGPIEMSEYDKVLTADNFIDEVQYAVEVEYDKEKNKPKQILADLMPVLIEKLMTAVNENMLEMGNVLDGALKSRDIQFYFINNELEKKVQDLGWGGEIKDTSGDYLAVFNSNIAGQKTDSVVNEKIEHETIIDKKGGIINTVTVTRTHNGVKGDLFTGVRNVNYARLYVPKGSILLRAEGFGAPDPHYFDAVEEGCVVDEDVQNTERITMIDTKTGTRVTEESGKTVFGNWVMVDPGESVTYSVTYRLPFKLLFKEPSFLESLFSKESVPIATYDLFVQKQSGSRNTEFINFTRLPENMDEAWYYDGSTGQNLQKLDSDKFFGKLIKKKLP